MSGANLPRVDLPKGRFVILLFVFGGCSVAAGLFCCLIVVAAAVVYLCVCYSKMKLFDKTLCIINNACPNY